nr:hypothetical protein GLBDPPGF_00015 [uncultured bacterium]
MDLKKRIELRYLEEARQACSMFPVGQPIPNEPLDFLFDGGRVGIEITELCREDERREGARLGYVAPRARRIYARLGGHPVNVSPVFSLDADEMDVETLAQNLADFVYNHRHANQNFEWHDHELPKGYINIGVFPPFDFEPAGDWRYFRVFSTTLATREQIAARIDSKNGRIAHYRAVASEVWLLIVNDLFLGPGEVAVRDDDLASWAFGYAFDKVLLFQRQPGGSGRVIELRRQ